MKKLSYYKNMITAAGLMILLAIASTLSSCGGNEPDPQPGPNPNPNPNPTLVVVDTAHIVAKANIQDISEKADAANSVLNNTGKEYLGSFTIEEGTIQITEDDFAALRKLGPLQVRLRSNFSAKAEVCPKNGDMPLSYFEWERWGSIGLAESLNGAMFLVSESEKPKFWNQPVKVDERFNGLINVPIMDYGADGNGLKGFLPDTIVFSEEQLDAKGMLQYKGLGDKKIILKTTKDSKMKFGQPFFTGMNNEILGMFETPSAPDFPGSGMKIVYQSMDDLVITDYVQEIETSVKTEPLSFAVYAYDIYAGNQGLVKLEASNKIAHGIYGLTARANVTASNSLEIVLPQTSQYKNPEGIYGKPIGFGQPTFYDKDKYVMVDIMTMDWYRHTLFTQSWAKTWKVSSFNDINIKFGPASNALIILTGNYPYWVATVGGNWETRREKLRELLLSDFGVSIVENYPLDYSSLLGGELGSGRVVR